MRVTIRGKKYNITKEAIERRMRGFKPEEGRVYFVEINGKEYPIKQVIKRVFNLPMAGFNSQDAFGILTRLDYRIITRG